MEVEGLKPRRESAESTGCGQPDVREAAFLALDRALVAEFGTEDEFAPSIVRQFADAVLAAVTPVIRRQVAEEIAEAIEELADLSLADPWTVTEAHATARDHAHSTQPTEEDS